MSYATLAMRSLALRERTWTRPGSDPAISLERREIAGEILARLDPELCEIVLTAIACDCSVRAAAVRCGVPVSCAYRVSLRIRAIAEECL
jgi:hypothetical protein